MRLSPAHQVSRVRRRSVLMMYEEGGGDDWLTGLVGEEEAAAEAEAEAGGEQGEPETSIPIGALNQAQVKHATLERP